MTTTLNKSTRILWLLLEFPTLFLLDYYFMNLPPLHFMLVTALLCFSHTKSFHIAFHIGARAGYLRARMDMITQLVDRALHNIAADANKEQK